MPVSIYSRYYGLETVEERDHVSIAQRPIPPEQTYSDQILHVIIGGETLDELAARYYGRADLWWRIADANPARFALDWQPGDVVVIPPVRVATRVPRG